MMALSATSLIASMASALMHQVTSSLKVAIPAKEVMRVVKRQGRGFLAL